MSKEQSDKLDDFEDSNRNISLPKVSNNGTSNNGNNYILFITIWNFRKKCSLKYVMISNGKVIDWNKICPNYQ